MSGGLSSLAPLFGCLATHANSKPSSLATRPDVVLNQKLSLMTEEMLSEAKVKHESLGQLLWENKFKIWQTNNKAQCLFHSNPCPVFVDLESMEGLEGVRAWMCMVSGIECAPWTPAGLQLGWAHPSIATLWIELSKFMSRQLFCFGLENSDHFPAKQICSVCAREGSNNPHAQILASAELDLCHGWPALVESAHRYQQCLPGPLLHEDGSETESFYTLTSLNCHQSLRGNGMHLCVGQLEPFRYGTFALDV